MSEIFKKIFKERNSQIRMLEKKYPKVVAFMNLVTTFVVLALLVSLAGWGIQTIRNRKAEEAAVIAFAEQRAIEEALERERQEAVLAEQRAIAERQLADTTLMAKLLAGVNGFVDNYGYSDGDLRTYAECVINRVIDQSNGFPNTIQEVILQEGQWVGFSENNQVIDKYNKIAAAVVASYYNNEPRPCAASYCWVDLRREGCWLKNAFGDSPYIKTWRYSA